MPVMEGVSATWSINVSGTPQSPNPPHKMVESDLIYLIASAAEGTTLLISGRRSEEEKFRAKRSSRYVPQLSALVQPCGISLEYGVSTHLSLISNEIPSCAK